MPHFRLTIRLLLLISAVSSSAAFGQQTPAHDPLMTSWASYAGVEQCCDCHYAGQQNPLRGGSDVGQISRQREARLWLEQDKHAIARQRIEPLLPAEIEDQRQRWRAKHGKAPGVEQWVGPSNELSRLICDRLGFDVSTDAGYQQFRDQCLRCHGGYTDDAEPRAFSRSDHRQPGISCTYCHQLRNRTDWVQQHPASDEWRLLPLEQKAAAGMRPLEAELAQADLCADCHVGNLHQHKFVTHAMYAAGHPPLPNFELQTFCEQMPQHWQTTAEVYAALADYDGRQAYFQLNYATLAAGRIPSADYSLVGWRTRKVLLGSVVARRRWLELLTEASNSERWGDYAFYDCMACHHELRQSSPRQEFGVAGIPGRPRQLLWPVALSRVAASQTPLAAELAAAEQALATALDRQPFGDRVVCAEAARQEHTVIERLQLELAAQPFDNSSRRAVLLQLTETPTSYLVDYLSARQVVWGIQQVARDPSAVQLDLHGANAETWHGICTQLPSGRSRFIFPRYLDEELQRRTAYVPHDLSVGLHQIRQELLAQ